MLLDEFTPAECIESDCIESASKLYQDNNSTPAECKVGLIFDKSLGPRTGLSAWAQQISIRDGGNLGGIQHTKFSSSVSYGWACLKEDCNWKISLRKSKSSFNCWCVTNYCSVHNSSCSEVVFACMTRNVMEEIIARKLHPPLSKDTAAPGDILSILFREFKFTYEKKDSNRYYHMARRALEHMKSQQHSLKDNSADIGFDLSEGTMEDVITNSEAATAAITLPSVVSDVVALTSPMLCVGEWTCASAEEEINRPAECSKRQIIVASAKSSSRKKLKSSVVSFIWKEVKDSDDDDVEDIWCEGAMSVDAVTIAASPDKESTPRADVSDRRMTNDCFFDLLDRATEAYQRDKSFNVEAVVKPVSSQPTTIQEATAPPPPPPPRSCTVRTYNAVGRPEVSFCFLTKSEKCSHKATARVDKLIAPRFHAKSRKRVCLKVKEIEIKADRELAKVEELKPRAYRGDLLTYFKPMYWQASPNGCLPSAFDIRMGARDSKNNEGYPQTAEEIALDYERWGQYLWKYEAALKRSLTM